MELILYSNPQSRGLIAQWMLEELGQPYQLIEIAYGPEMQTAAYKALNPMAKVPTLIHKTTSGSHVVTECAAICAYLADAFPEAGLLPAPEHRAPYFRWLFFTAGPVEAAISSKFLKAEPTPEQEPMVGYGSFQRAIAALETAIPKGNDWIAGPTFSAADVYVGSQVMWGLAFGTIPETPALRAYADKLAARPAYQRMRP